MIIKRSLLLVLVIIPFTLLSQRRDNRVSDFDKYAEQARKDWRVPGMAVAVIKDGKVLLAKGYGEREIGSGEKVNENTIFNIGSTTKAFTACAVAILVDQGKLGWDDRVVDHMPEFQLYDSYATQDMRVRDLLTHNMGLPNSDYLWYTAGYAPDETLRRMRYLKPVYPLRGGYTYQNVMYIAAGALIKKVSGVTWEDFVQENIFNPLGMNNSYPNLERSKSQGNRSVPHHWKRGEGEVIAIEDVDFDNAGPAGTIWSSVSDMSKWITAMIDSSKYDGGRLVKAETWSELFKPHTNIPKSQFYPTHRLINPKWTTYALGWFQQDYNGRNMDFHTGSIDGTIALAGMIRDEKLGYYFLANLDHAEVRHALMYKAFDMFGVSDEGRDWSVELKKLYGDPVERLAVSLKRMNESRIPDTKPNTDLENYAGVYTNKLWGEIEVEFNEGQLSAVTPMQGKLEHWHHDTFTLPPDNEYRMPTVIQFELAPDGSVRSLSIGGSEDYRFGKSK